MSIRNKNVEKRPICALRFDPPLFFICFGFHPMVPA